MQHFKQYKSVAQIAQLSDGIHKLQKYLGEYVLKEFDQGFNAEGALVGQAWLLHDSCLVASVLDEPIRYEKKTCVDIRLKPFLFGRETIVKRYVDLQLKSYRQIFSRITEDVAQLDHLSRRYAFLKRTLKTCEEVQIFPDSWAVSARISEKFCEYTK